MIAAIPGVKNISHVERIDTEFGQGRRQHSGGAVGEFTIPLEGGIVEVAPTAPEVSEVKAPEVDANLYRDYLVARAYVISGRGFEDVKDLTTLTNINLLNGMDLTFDQFQDLKQQAQDIFNGTQKSEG